MGFKSYSNPTYDSNESSAFARLRFNLGRMWLRATFTSRQVGLPIKLRLCVSFYQIITQFSRVTSFVEPPAYRHLLSVFHVVNLSFWG